MRARQPPLGSPLARGSYALALATPAVGAANFAVHALAGRQLGTNEYGILAALLSGVLILLVPLGALQVSIARLLIERVLNPQRVFKHSLCAALAIFVAVFAVSPLVSRVIQSQGTGPVVLMGTYAAIAAAGIVPRAILLAQERLGLLATLTLVPGFVRLGISVVVLRLGGGLESLLAASVAGELATLVALLLCTGGQLKDERDPSVAWRSHLPPVFALAGIWALLAVDVFVARALLPGAAAATYAVTALIAKSIMFLPNGLIQAAFPRLVNPDLSASAKASARLHILVTSLLGIAALGAGGQLAAQILYGGRYELTTQTLVILGIASATIALASLSAHDRIAQGKPAAVRIWSTVVVATLMGLAVGRSGTALAITMSLCGGLLAALVRTRSDGAPCTRALKLSDPTVDLSLVMPMFNPGPSAVSSHLQSVFDHLAETDATFEIIVVDDGSTDGSLEAVRGLPHASIRVISTAHAGKGSAIRAGMGSASGELIGFIDSDGDIPARHVLELLDALRTSPELDGALASKNLTQLSTLRRIASRAYRLVASLTLDVNVPDTQTGLKIVRREVIASVLPWCVESGFTFDAEFLAISSRLGFSRFVMIPVHLERFAESTIRMTDALALVRHTLRVASRVGQLPVKTPQRRRAVLLDGGSPVLVGGSQLMHEQR